MDRAGRRAVKRDRTRTEPARSGGSRLRLVGLVVLCAKLALVPVVFDPSADVPFVVPKALLSHALTYVLVAVMLGLVIQDGRSFFVHSWVHVPVLAFLVVSGVAAAFAVNPTLALFGTHVRMLGLTTIGDGVITYVAVAHLVRRRREAIWVMGSIFAASALVLAYEIVQWLGRDPFSWNFDGSQRPFATLGQPTSLGEYLSILSVVAIGLACLVPGARYQVRLLLGGYALLLLVGVGLTGTRSAAIGLAMAGGAFVVLVWAKHPNKRARSLSLIGAGGAALVLAFVLLLTPIGARLASTVQSSPSGSNDSAAVGLEESASVRLVLYGIAAQIVRERPLFGYGPDNFAAGVPVYRPAPVPFEIRQSLATSAHSWLAYVATSSGLLGLAAYCFLIIAAAVVLFRSAFNPLGIVAALAAVAYLGSGLTTINSIEIDTLFWVAIGAVVSATSSAGSYGGDAGGASIRPRRSRSGSDQLIARLAPWALVALSVVLASTMISALEASRLAKRSVSARLPSTAALAIDLSLRATQLDSNRAEYQEQLALAYVAAARLPEASRAFKSAARLAPYDIRFLNDDIQVQLLLANRGDAAALSEAAQLADRAVLIDPNNPLGHQNRAIIALVRRDFQGAVDSITRGLGLAPDPSDSLLKTGSDVFVTAAQSYLGAGLVDKARDVAQQGVAALGARPVSVATRVEYIRALAASGRTSEALAEIDAVLTLSPGNETALRLRDQLQGK